jgi:hypothetical protein
MQITQLQGVLIDQAKIANTSQCKVDRRSAAQPAQPDYGHFGTAQFSLSFPSEFCKCYLPTVKCIRIKRQPATTSIYKEYERN